MNNSLTGILGGMGPLASSGFVNFLYQKCRSKFSDEQSYPRIILLSDPTIPDRMACVSNNNVKNLITTLESNVQKLLLLGAERVIICCFTAHYFLKALSIESQKSIINLGELLKTHLDKARKNTLILCSELLAQSRLIDSEYAIYPEKIYFGKIHQFIYKIKLNGPTLYQSELVAFAQSLAKLYSVSQVLFACTEFHLIYQSMHSDLIEDKVKQPSNAVWTDLPHFARNDSGFDHFGENGKVLLELNSLDDKISILDGLDIAADFLLKENM